MDKVKKVSEDKGLRPNVAQRRPEGMKPSPPRPFNLHRQQGR